MLIDTHAHIHSQDFIRPLAGNKDSASLQEDFSVANMLKRAKAAGVEHILCVGTTESDSKLAVEFTQKYQQCSATIGIHPHDAKRGEEAFRKLASLAGLGKIVAIGECGLDYYYQYSPKDQQKLAFEYQLKLAAKYNLPVVFHIRDAFEDFLRIIDNYPGITGVVHSFTADVKTLEKVLKKGFYVGLNGIMTFTKDQAQLESAKRLPLERLLLETDCPFLTPVPKRGTINEPANVKIIAEFLADLRGESLEKLASAATQNARKLFKL